MANFRIRIITIIDLREKKKKIVIMQPLVQSTTIEVKTDLEQK